MKKSFRVIAGIVIISMVIMNLAGCKENTTEPSASSQSQTIPGTTPTENGNVNGYPDLGGIILRVGYGIGYSGSETAPFADKGQNGVVMTERINEIQENYNCKFEWVSDDRDFWQKIHTSILIGKPVVDITRSDYWTIVISAEKGGLYAILNDYNDILELDSTELWDQTLLDEFYTIDGMLFGAEAPKYGIEQVYGGAVCFFNKSMLEREGIWDDYNLYDMQKNKTWTWSTMDEIGTKVLKDTDGNGSLDQFGLIYKYTITHMGFNASNTDKLTGWGWYEVDADGVPRFRGRDADKLRLLHYFNDMGPTGKGWLRALEWSGEQAETGPTNTFAEGKAAFFVDMGNQIETLKKLKMQDTLGVVAMPIGPDNTKNEYNIARVYYDPWIIPRNIGNPEAAAYILKELSRPLYSEEDAEIGIEATLADIIGNESEIIESFKMLGQRGRAVYNKETPFIATWAGVIASYHGSFMGAIIESGYLPEQLNDLYGDQIQTFINDYWLKVTEGAGSSKKQRK